MRKLTRDEFLTLEEIYLMPGEALPHWSFACWPEEHRRIVEDLVGKGMLNDDGPTSDFTLTDDGRAALTDPVL